jgi:iron complex outermembrane receptor protein
MKNLRMKPLALAVAMALPVAVQAQVDGETDETRGSGSVEEVIVTGSYAASLADALNAKRTAINSRESIMAEDMGKMPDLNLAESLQRVPGVAISREGGEGRQITVRGLGSEFTRTTLNGMEVPASTDGLDSSGGTNGSRAFDFNIFASEMFNRIDIHKSQTASIEEGGIAGTVDLYTGKPFDMPGFNASVSAQAAYNNVGGDVNPRIAGMISNTFADDTIGVLASIAVTERDVRQEGFGTVRWTSAYENGNMWADSSNVAGLNVDRDAVNCPDQIPTPDETDAEDAMMDLPAANCAWHPRLPRMDYFGNVQDRLGATLAFQWRPTDRSELGLDFVHSSFDNERNMHNFQANFRNEQGTITPTSITLDPTNTYMTAGTFEGVVARSESRGTFSGTDFNQVVLNGEFDLTDNVTLSGLIGNATSDFDVEQYRFNMDTIPMDFGFSFAEDPNIAELDHGIDIMDPGNYSWSNPTIRRTEIERDNTTVKFDAEIRGDNSTVLAGIIWNDREVANRQLNADFTFPDSVEGLTQGVPVDDFADALGDAPDGFPRNWLMNDFGATIEAYNVQEWQENLLDRSVVNEETLGAYVEFQTQAQLLDRPLHTSAGLRVVETQWTASGFRSVGDEEVPNAVGNTYVDVLPSTNIVWELSDEFQLRFSAARAMTRPGLGALSPQLALDGINGQISSGNADLDPQRANSVDISAEWYFAEDALLAATAFYKDIESFIATDTVSRRLTDEEASIIQNDPEWAASWPSVSQAWEFEQPINNDGAQLEGMEFIYQQPFTFLPGTGITANYMFVHSRSQYGSGDQQVTADLIGLSDETVNLTLYYENETYGARMSYNSRSDYLTSVPGSNGNAAEATTGPDRIDASAFYNITDDITVTLEAINLTNEPERLYVTGPMGGHNLVREYNTTGRQIFLGVRADF